jgi:hypothetical protein
MGAWKAMVVGGAARAALSNEEPAHKLRERRRIGWRWKGCDGTPASQKPMVVTRIGPYTELGAGSGIT